jgi:hypothetical protein
MTSYRQEQIKGHQLVLAHLGTLRPEERQHLSAVIGPYLDFRRRTADFLHDHFGGVCTRTCYENNRSACCSKDGIITFFADLVVNALAGGLGATRSVIETLHGGESGFKCIYLGRDGCIWRLKPIVCEMFLCPQARRTVFTKQPQLENAWEKLEVERKSFTWPDRPVLFDDLEQRFIQNGVTSPLMYLNNSPGLLRLKQKAGLCDDLSRVF